LNPSFSPFTKHTMENCRFKPICFNTFLMGVSSLILKIYHTILSTRNQARPSLHFINERNLIPITVIRTLKARMMFEIEGYIAQQERNERISIGDIC